MLQQIRSTFQTTLFSGGNTAESNKKLTSSLFTGQTISMQPVQPCRSPRAEFTPQVVQTTIEVAEETKNIDTLPVQSGELVSSKDCQNGYDQLNSVRSDEGYHSHGFHDESLTPPYGCVDSDDSDNYILDFR